jgi:hypothetical protein
LEELFHSIEKAENIKMEIKRDSMNGRRTFYRTFGSIPQERPGKDMIWICQAIENDTEGVDARQPGNE